MEFAPGVRGAWVVPDGAWDGRTVILLHGMASDMDDAGDLLKQLAGRLVEKGIASLRFTFRGEGRENTVLASTFPMRLEDAAAARAWACAQPGVDRARVGVLGFSLGASTAIITGARHPDWFKSMVLWSSPSGDLFALWSGNETAQRALRAGEATEEIPGWKKLTTKREFYESFQGFDTDAALSRFPGAFLAIRGTDDFLAARDLEMVKLVRGRPAEALLIGGADHIFHAFQPELGHAGRLLDATVAWFERTL